MIRTYELQAWSRRRDARLVCAEPAGSGFTIARDDRSFKDYSSAMAHRNPKMWVSVAFERAAREEKKR